MTFQRSSVVVPQVSPPAPGAFTLRQTNANGTLLDTPDGLDFFARRVSSGEDSVLADQAIPGGASSPFTLTVGFIPTFGGQDTTPGFFNYSLCGIHLYEVATARIATMTIYGQADGGLRFQLAYKTGLTATGSISGGFDVGAYPIVCGPQVWFRVQDDGLAAAATNRSWSYSNDGVNFQKLTTQIRTTGFTTAPDRVGLHVNALNANARMLVKSYSLVGVNL